MEGVWDTRRMVLCSLLEPIADILVRGWWDTISLPLNLVDEKKALGNSALELLSDLFSDCDFGLPPPPAPRTPPFVSPAPCSECCLNT